MFSRLPISLSACILWVAIAPGCSNAESERLKSADRELFAWFDQLGLEDIGQAQLVRVRTGQVTYVGEKRKRQPDEPRGFLLWEKDGKFRLLLGDLTTATFVHAGKAPEDDDYVGWRPVAPEEEAGALLHTLAKEEDDGFWNDDHDVYTDRLDLRGQAFVLARFCAACGREELAAQLLRFVERRILKDNQTDHLADVVQALIGEALAWRATLALADRQQDRHALAALFRSISVHCPNCYRQDWVLKTTEALEKMAIEDDAHVTLNAKELERLPPADQARELIFQLRDEYVNMQDMWPRPWPFEPPQGNGALAKLKALDLPAVPALLAALNDDRPTRSVYRNHRYGGGASADEMRELATQALNHIAGVNLYSLIPNGGMMKFEERSNQLRALAEDWWKTTREKGKTEWLRARITAGAYGSEYCLDALARWEPIAFGELAMSSIPETKDARTRAGMVERLRNVDTPKANAFLLEEMAHGPTLSNRLVAAYLLRHRHCQEAMSAMLAAWSSRPESPKELPRNQPSLLNRFSFFSPLAIGDEPDSPIQLLCFFLTSDSPDAIRKVQDALSHQEPFTRCELIEYSGRRLDLPASETVEPASPATRDAIEALLISALTDETVLAGSNINDAQDPKLGEIAAQALTECWRSKYHFEIHAPPEVRAAQIAEIRTKALP